MADGIPSEEGRRGATATATAMAACECSRVLVVDDNDTNIFAAEMMLRKEGLKCTKAINGCDAIEKAVKASQCPTCKGFELILMDCDMPIMNGYEASERLVTMMKARELKTAPIVAVTAFTKAQCLAECLKSGMREHSNEIHIVIDIVEKPISIKRLRAVLAKYHMLP